MAKVFLFVIIVTVCVSCLKEYNCSTVYLNPVFIGFHLSDVDTILIKKYDKAGNFMSQIKYHNPVQYKVKNDSIEVTITAPDYKLTENYRYQLILLTQFSNTTISDINEEQKRGKCLSKQTTNCSCDNAITSYKQNGQTIAISTNGKPYFYIRK